MGGRRNLLLATYIVNILEWKKMIKDEYLGDGVYASFDGYHIWLAANHHNNKVIALEPPVMLALRNYEKKIKDHMNEKA